VTDQIGGSRLYRLLAYLLTY